MEQSGCNQQKKTRLGSQALEVNAQLAQGFADETHHVGRQQIVHTRRILLQRRGIDQSPLHREPRLRPSFERLQQCFVGIEEDLMIRELEHRRVVDGVADDDGAFVREVLPLDDARQQLALAARMNGGAIRRTEVLTLVVHRELRAVHVIEAPGLTDGLDYAVVRSTDQDRAAVELLGSEEDLTRQNVGAVLLMQRDLSRDRMDIRRLEAAEESVLERVRMRGRILVIRRATVVVRFAGPVGVREHVLWSQAPLDAFVRDTCTQGLA